MVSTGEHKDMSTVLYDFLLWLLSVVLDLFFREVHPRSSWKIPRRGPVIFVAAPHANQFVDPLLLMRIIRTEAHRRVSVLIAEKSTKRKFVGWMSRKMGALSVGRALDKTQSASGKVYMPDPENDPCLIRGVGTNFQDPSVQLGGLLVLPSVNYVSANAEIVEVLGPEELRLKKPFQGSVAFQQLTGTRQEHKEDPKSTQTVEEQINKARDNEGTLFRIAPKVDQSKVYEAVFEGLSRGGCVGIYPEGGSHDRTELLPLKAGVAIMALGAVAHDPSCDLKIVPCGMNYFHAHKFRSRAVIEFGTPLDVPKELVEEYKNGSRRDAIGQMLQMVYDALVSVTVTSPDYETLMLIQAVRRLYNPPGKKLPLSMVVELNRRLVKGYTRYRDDPRIVRLKKRVLDYNKSLMALNVRDHQLGYAKFSVIQVMGIILYRLGKIIILAAAVFPGLALFSPVFIAGKLISIRKSREALAASTVKIQARDVVATWKLLVAMALAPALYTYYNILFGFWTYYNRMQGLVPPWVPVWAVVLFGTIWFPAITFAALRFGEIGMDIAKSLWPLILSLNPSSGNTIVKLRKRREELAMEVTNLINELGPELFPDFDARRIVVPKDGSRPKTPDSPSKSPSWGTFLQMTPRGESPDGQTPHTRASIGGGSSMAGNLPRNESFKNLSSFGFFASRPQTPASHRSLSRPGSQNDVGADGVSLMNSEKLAEDVSMRIRGAMRERGRHRVSSGARTELESESEESEVEDGVPANGHSVKKDV
ncbi:MAG: hypothetical protein Q9162_002049 [Coniocarpon cinnabarinum]